MALIAWADYDTKSFKDFVRPQLMKLDCQYQCLQQFPGAIHSGDVCLTFGKDNLKELGVLGHTPKNRAITSMRGQLLGHGIGNYLVTWDAGLAFIDWGRRPEILWDIKLAKRLMDTGLLMPETGAYSEVQSLVPVLALITELYEKGGKQAIPVGVDLETVGFDYVNPDAHIVALSITVAQGSSFVMYFEMGDELESLDWDILAAICRGMDGWVKVYGSNFKFDALWLEWKWHIQDFSGFKLDTTLVGSLLQENRSNSLNLHAKIYTTIGGYDDEFNRKYDKSRMDLVPRTDVIQYAGGDTDACYRVAVRMRSDLLKQKRLARFYTKLLHPAQHAVRKMEFRGMVVDMDKYKQLDEEVTQVLETNQERMIDMLPYRLRHKHYRDLRPSRPKIVSDFLFTKQGLNLKPKMMTAKTKVPSTSADHFQLFSQHDVAGPFIECLLEFNKASKTKSTYIDGFMTHLRADGRFHPSYILFRGKFHGDDAKDDDSGGRTGRTSCKEPAYQTLPKRTDWAKPLRSVYVPPEGYVILDLDFQQGELRITACIAEEPTMIQSYKDGVDLHLKTGAQLNGYEYDEALEMWANNDPLIAAIRQGGKAGNFGLIYTMGAEGFVDYAWKSYGVEITLQEAYKFIDAFFNLYDRLHPWHDEVREFAREHKYIESPLGRIRHLPLITTWMQDIRAKQERQAINTGVQATLTDMGLLAMAELDKLFPDLWLFGFTHDSLSFYVPEDEYMEWAKRIKAVMENLPLGTFGWKPQLDFPVDVQLGLNNLGETVEIPVPTIG
jgi:DNA polymerase I-like protein with 3'-5' exonuclease and polymerase domains